MSTPPVECEDVQQADRAASLGCEQERDEVGKLSGREHALASGWQNPCRCSSPPGTAQRQQCQRSRYFVITPNFTEAMQRRSFMLGLVEYAIPLLLLLQIVLLTRICDLPPGSSTLAWQKLPMSTNTSLVTPGCRKSHVTGWLDC